LFHEQPFWLNTLIILGVLVATSIYDLKHREVPDWAWGSLLVWAVVASIFKFSPVGWLSVLLGMIAALIMATGLWYVGRKMYEGEMEEGPDGQPEEKEGLGMGDVKLMGALGAALGLGAIGYAMLWMLAGGFVLALWAKIRGKTTFAFVPAIAIGISIYLIFDRRVFALPESWIGQ